MHPTGASPAAPEVVPSIGATSGAYCVHHFILSSPNGPTCEGVCRKCNERRTYSSSGEDDLTISIRHRRTYPKPEVLA